MKPNQTTIRDDGFTLVEIMIVVAIIGLLTTIAIPAFLQYRKDTRAGLCQSNLRLIYDAKEVVAIKNMLSTGDAVDVEDVDAYINGGAPVCQSGGMYAYKGIDADPTCSFVGVNPDHDLLYK
jgi:prepilin-type N-terminal cleavage/methylation domain-containing protein